MRGLDPRLKAHGSAKASEMAGTSPAMTKAGQFQRDTLLAVRDVVGVDESGLTIRPTTVR